MKLISFTNNILKMQVNGGAGSITIIILLLANLFTINTCSCVVIFMSFNTRMIFRRKIDSQRN